jgi:hypothetical protein
MLPAKHSFNILDYMGEEKQYANPTNLSGRPDNGFGVHLPNGIYRYTVRVGTKADPGALFGQLKTETRTRLHDDNF